jgi:DNA-binding SARP family transcriptional activator
MRAEINVLGALEMTVDGISVVPSAAKPRQVLAMLAVNIGRVVTRTALMEELWAASTPRSAPSTLQTYVLHVRRLIREALPAGQEHLARELLATRPTGYQLEADPEVSDLVRYDRLATAGRAAGGAGDFENAERLLSEALGLWRGPAFVDVVAGPQLEIESTRLSESRLSDLTLRIDAQLYLGGHHQLLGDLAALCARHPYTESFRGQYMLALYRCGRPGDALTAYEDLRTTIRDHLGVEPSSRLRELHQALLRGDSLLDDPTYTVNAWEPDARHRATRAA